MWKNQTEKWISRGVVSFSLRHSLKRQRLQYFCCNFFLKQKFKNPLPTFCWQGFGISECEKIRPINISPDELFHFYWSTKKCLLSGLLSHFPVSYRKTDFRFVISALDFHYEYISTWWYLHVWGRDHTALLLFRIWRNFIFLGSSRKPPSQI